MICNCENKCSETTTGCSCYGNGIVIPTGAQGEQGEQGPQGLQGDQGVSVSDSIVSDGSTAIGGVVYPLNTVVLELSDGTFLDSGIINVNVSPLVWNVLPMNGDFTSNPFGFVAEYSIDPYGVLRFRGRVSKVGAGAGTVSDMTAIIPLHTKRYELTCRSTNGFTAPQDVILDTGILTSTYTSDEPLSLESITPVYILD